MVDDSGGMTNNKTTAHESCAVIDVDGDYAGSQNRCIYCINNSKLWMARATAAASIVTDSTSVTVCSGNLDGETSRFGLTAARLLIPSPRVS